MTGLCNGHEAPGSRQVRLVSQQCDKLVTQRPYFALWESSRGCGN